MQRGGHPFGAQHKAGRHPAINTINSHQPARARGAGDALISRPAQPGAPGALHPARHWARWPGEPPVCAAAIAQCCAMRTCAVGLCGMQSPPPRHARAPAPLQVQAHGPDTNVLQLETHLKSFIALLTAVPRTSTGGGAAISWAWSIGPPSLPASDQSRDSAPAPCAPAYPLVRIRLSDQIIECY